MELYVLDSLLRRTAVVDQFDSLIWTERYSSSGDFQLVIHATDENRSLLTPGLQLALNESNRVMTIEEVTDQDDSSGRSLLTIKGPSLEDWMTQRTTRGAGTGASGDVSVWTITDTPTGIARNLFNSICIANSVIPADNLPFYKAGSLYPGGTIAEPDTIYSFNVPTDSVYNVIKSLADSYGFGFRITRGPDTSALYFEIYMGSDRTTAQNDLPVVIFSEALGTLTDVSQLNSITGYYNTAYVYSTNGSAVVYAEGMDSVTGFGRRVLNVQAKDITLAAGTDLDAALQVRGAQELAKYKQLQAIDGKAPPLSLYRYGIDYNLGDLVEMRDPNGNTQNMRVTEQIFASDIQGDRSYPTLVADVFITPGSWSAWDSNEQWADEPTASTWATP